jgi:sporulation protein YlmC with PRC-barrel domain
MAFDSSKDVRITKQNKASLITQYMKTTLLCGAALAILGVAAVPLSAQNQSTTSTSTTNYIQTSKLIGTKVKASEGEEVGEIKDVVLDQNGCMAYTVLSTSGGGGGRVSGSSSSVKTVAVPWSVYSTTSDPRVMTVRVQRDRIYNAPAFEYSRINEYSTGNYLNNVYSYYGVSPGVGVSTSVSGGVSGSTTTNTGVNTNTGATTGVGASTNATAAPSPGASATSSLPSASPTASASASAGPSASPVDTASPSPSRQTSRGDKAKSGMTPVSPHRRANQPADTVNGTGSPTEASPSKRKSSEASSEGSPSKKAHRRGTEGSEPSATPAEPEKQ